MIQSFKIFKKYSPLIFYCCVGFAAKAQDNASQNLQYVDLRIGNVGQLLEPTRPTIQLPNQMIRMYPERKDYLDDQITSFPLNAVSHRLGQVFSVKPFTKTAATPDYNEKLAYDHDLEINRPWYYSTYLIDEDVQVEFTPGKKTGIFRFRFPQKASRTLLFNLYNNGEGSWKFISDHEIVATETYHDDIVVHMYGTFSGKGKTGLLDGTKPVPEKSAKGKKVKAWINFPNDGAQAIEFKYAISYVSAEQARKNYENELRSDGFEELKSKGEKVWSDVINQIQVEGGTEAQKRTFYSALYRTYERMTDISEDNKYYSGFDKKIHTSARPFYTDDWTWDTYLAHHPLRVILNPRQEEDMLNSFVSMYEQSGWMPTFPVLFGDHACMNGFHSAVTFLDGYRKGLRNFDVSKAYSGMYKNATEATMLPWRNGPKCELDDFYHKNGYFPSLRLNEKETVKLADPFEKRQAVAVTLGGSYDDWALAELAKDLGKNKDYDTFKLRALNYKNLWNTQKNMFLPKDKNGQWIDIDPKFDGGMGGRDFYDENNGWTYKWQVQHDINGLIGLTGGKQKFEEELDQLYREGLGRSKYEFWAKFPDATGLVGQYSMGNEPSFHIPYLYNYTDSPWKTQKRIRFLLDVWFKDNIFGIPGDEDGGGMTAFVVFSSMGFYPITPGKPEYTIGSPVFEKVTIALQSGRKFTMVAKNCSVVNKYIQSAKFDGKVLNIPSFTHDQLTAGGTLELEMGPKPNKNWGRGE